MNAVPADKARASLEVFGRCVGQSSDDWKGASELPECILSFYREVGPADISVPLDPEEVLFPSLSNLWDLQNGYCWNSETGEKFGDWPSHWLVVAYYAGDAFIYDSVENVVLFAEHGTGHWEPRTFVNDMNALACCIGCIGIIFADNEDDLLDDDLQIRPNYVRLVRNRLADILGNFSEADNIVSVLGIESIV